jgi:hypothetical protein
MRDLTVPFILWSTTTAIPLPFTRLRPAVLPGNTDAAMAGHGDHASYRSKPDNSSPTRCPVKSEITRGSLTKNGGSAEADHGAARIRGDSYRRWAIADAKSKHKTRLPPEHVLRGHTKLWDPALATNRQCHQVPRAELPNLSLSLVKFSAVDSGARRRWLRRLGAVDSEGGGYYLRRATSG